MKKLLNKLLGFIATYFVSTLLVGFMLMLIGLFISQWFETWGFVSFIAGLSIDLCVLHLIMQTFSDETQSFNGKVTSQTNKKELS